MPIVARQPESNFAPCPEGLQQVVCVDVIDLGLVDTGWGESHQVRLVWQTHRLDDRGRPFQLRKQYRNSLHEKANLRRDLEMWRGRKFSPDELKGFDLEKLIGINAQIQVIHDVKDEGRVYANVQAIIPLGVKMPRIAAREYVRAKDKPADQKNVPPPPPTAGPPPIADDDYVTDDEIPF